LTVNGFILMMVLRRRLASGALALIALQLALLFALPVSACCLPAAASAKAGASSMGAAARTAAVAASEDAPDCCPPGAHPKGECPLHRGARNHCRFTCGRSSGPEFLIGAIGVLPAPSEVFVPFAESAAPVPASTVVPLRSSVPDAPPPRLL
jgi:hypothetical protein